MSIYSINLNNYASPCKAVGMAGMAYAGYSIFSALFRSSSSELSRESIHQTSNANDFLPREDFYRIALEGVRQCIPTPAYIHQIIHPGLAYVTRDGRAGYEIQNEKLLSYDHFKSQFQEIVNYKNENPAEFNRQMKALCSSRDQDNKGCGLMVGGEDKLLINIPRQKMQNHKAMIDFLRSWVSDIDTLSVTEVLQKLQKTHRLLFKGINIEGIGTYRTKNMIVFPDTEEDRDRSLPNLSRLLLQRGGSKEDLETLQEIFKTARINERVTEQDQKTLAKIAFIPCDHREVLEKMSTFILELKEDFANFKRYGKGDPIALGDFVHRRIGEIHPFPDGNGRIARAFMNAILMEFQVDPVVFLSDDAYTAAIQKEAEKPGYFLEYLESEIIPKTRQAKAYLNN